MFETQLPNRIEDLNVHSATKVAAWEPFYVIVATEDGSNRLVVLTVEQVSPGGYEEVDYRAYYGTWREAHEAAYHLAFDLDDDGNPIFGDECGICGGSHHDQNCKA